MAIFARVEKTHEDENLIRYRYEDSAGSQRTLIFEKSTEKLSPEDGPEDTLYRAVAMKLAGILVRSGESPERFMVQS